MEETVRQPLSRRPALRLGRLDGSGVLWIAAAALLLFLVVVPLGWLLLASFQDDTTSALTVHNYVDAFTQSVYIGPILNSLKLSLTVAAIAVAVGTPLAWLVSRTDMPARGLVRALVMAGFVTPEFLGAIAWIFLAAPNSGWINRIWLAVTHGSQPPLNVYTMQGAIFVIAVYSVPYAFTFVGGALDNMATELEDAATTLGSGWLRTTLQITLPLALPAIAAGFIMSFLETISLFGAPAFLLIPARQQVMTTQLYLFFSQYPPQADLAAAYAIPLLMVTLTMLFLRQRLLGRRRFTTVTGKAGTRRQVRLGRWRWPAFCVALIPPGLSVLLPFTALLLVSLSRVWGKGPFAPGNLGLYWYRWALVDNPTTRSAIVHSLLYGGAAATIAAVLATVIAYMASRQLMRGTQVLGFIAMAPFVVPGIVLAIGFFAAYTHPPIVLYGTAGILIAAFATRFLPIAYSNAGALLHAINPDLENAARTLGASRARTLATITVPLLRSGLLSGWLLVFIPAIRELSAAVFLSTPGTMVMTTVIFDFSDAGNYEAVSTMGILLMAATFVIVLLARRLAGGDVTRSRTAGA